MPDFPMTATATAKAPPSPARAATAIDLALIDLGKAIDRADAAGCRREAGTLRRITAELGEVHRKLRAERDRI
jgi:hypothetical protein